MNLVEKEYCYLIEDVFPENVIAGFTKNNIPGDYPDDIKKTLSFLGKDINDVYLNQTHSSRVNQVEKEGVYEGDASFTRQSNLVLRVGTADCLPLFFCSEQTQVIGMVHMGWRSAKEGILDNIPFEMVSFKILAGVGLRKCCYQVGREFFDYPRLSKYVIENKSSLCLDPVRFAKDELCGRGLKENKWFDLNICSFCSRQKIFSYRKTKTSLRTFSFICRV